MRQYHLQRVVGVQGDPQVLLHQRVEAVTTRAGLIDPGRRQVTRVPTGRALGSLGREELEPAPQPGEFGQVDRASGLRAGEGHAIECESQL